MCTPHHLISHLPQGCLSLMLLLPFLLLLRVCCGAFVETFAISNLNHSQFLLLRFVIDVAMDTDDKLLKFFINSKVSDYSNRTRTDALISDVDPISNRYTTFHVDIDFMGKTFILENLRFCDLVAVKNTSAYGSSVRYPDDSLSSSSSSSSVASEATAGPNPLSLFNLSSISRRSNLNDTSNVISADDYLAGSNTTVAAFFTNSTGELVQCPLYQNDSIVMYYQADVSAHYQKLGSYTVRFTVVSNGEDPVIIGAARTYVTPVLRPQYIFNILFFGILSLLLATSCINYFTIVFSPNQESSNPFLVDASTICNEKLLNELEANTHRIVQYLQFALFMSGLNVQYPGFYQPLIGNIRWCALMGIYFIGSLSSSPQMESSNVYITFNSGGMNSLALYSFNGFIHYSWPNFMICLLAWITITLVVYQMFIMLKLVAKRCTRCWPWLQRLCPFTTHDSDPKEDLVFTYSVSKNLSAVLGHILNQFLYTFGFAFLVLTLFMLYTAGETNGHSLGFSNKLLHVVAFSHYMPYDFLHSGRRPRNGTHATVQERSHAKHLIATQIPTSSIAAGSVSLVAWLALLTFFIFRYLITIRNWQVTINNRVRKLYSSVKTVLVWADAYKYYHPDKVQYVIVDTAYAILALFIIGLMQKNGTIQVVLLIVVEFFQLLLLFTIRPFYNNMSWHSLAWMLPAARFLVTVLSIPFIRDLNVSEASRTYVAYAQLIIHLVVALIFTIKLLFGFGLTISAIGSSIRTKRQLKKYLGASKTGSVVDINGEFEYQPVTVPVHERQINEEVAEKGATVISPQATVGNEEEVDYYRSQSGRILQQALNRDPSLMSVASPKPVSNIEEGSLNSEYNYYQSESRKRQNDYTTREGDKIYQKYFFGDDAVDPEIRKLWASRGWNQEEKDFSSEAQTSIDNHSVIAAIGKKVHSLWGKKKEKPMPGFQVSRPRPLVVKRLSEIEGYDDSLRFYISDSKEKTSSSSNEPNF